MTREWKPGDVASIKGNGVEAVAIRTAERSWVWVDRNGSNPIKGACFMSNGATSTIRPLVVIDPEDREQCEDLADALVGVGVPNSGWDLIRAALREFTDPKPPKPEEPMGNVAVVLDAHDDWWVRMSRGAGGAVWQRVGYPDKRANYFDIDAVRVLSEGVQP